MIYNYVKFFFSYVCFHRWYFQIIPNPCVFFHILHTFLYGNYVFYLYLYHIYRNSGFLQVYSYNHAIIAYNLKVHKAICYGGRDARGLSLGVIPYARSYVRWK